MADTINRLAVVQTNDIKRDEYFARRIEEMIKLERSQFVFSNLGRSIEIPKNHGTKTIRLRRYNSLPVDLTVNGQGLALVEGVAPTPLKVQGQKVDGTISQYGAFIEETDWSKDIHMDDIKSIYQPELARHAAEVTERVILAAIDADASEWFIGDNAGTAIAAVNSYTTASLNTTITLKELRKVALVMKNYRRGGHTKYGGKPVVVMHPNVMEDLLDDSDLINKLLVPGNDNTPIKNGSLQQYKAYGMFFVETLIADITASTGTGTPNVYTSYMLGKDPYVVINLGRGGVEWKMTGFKPDSNDPLGQKQTFGYKMWTGAKVIDPIAITKIYSLSTYDVEAVFDVAGAGGVGDDNLGAAADQTAV